MNFSRPDIVIQEYIDEQDYFPGNRRFPLLIYQRVFPFPSPQAIQDLLMQNGWSNAWLDSIYDFHHYHSKTHEVLVIVTGHCEVQFGGEKGAIYTVSQGDVVIIPVGVAHKSLDMSIDFQCMGAYPTDVGPDMNYGEKEEYIKAMQSIQQVGLPAKDPIFGEDGLLFTWWN